MVRAGELTASRSTAPVFVVGLQRSGTTLLQALIGAHPHIAAPPEVYFFTRIYELRDYYGDLTDDATLRRVVHELLNPAYPMFEGVGFDEEAVFQRVRRSKRGYGDVLDAMLSDLADRQGKARWCEKSPGQLADQIWQAFPSAFVVHIVRSPTQTVASQLAMPWTTRPAKELARFWRDHTLANLSAGEANPDRYRLVRYEELTREPADVLRSVFEFLGEDYQDDILTEHSRRATAVVPGVPWQERVLQPVRSDLPPSGSRLGLLDRWWVNALTDPAATRCGYTRAPLTGRLLRRGLRSLAARSAPRHRPPAADRPRLSPEQRYELVQAFMRERAELAREALPQSPPEG